MSATQLIALNKGNYSFVCQMPKIIKALLKKQGKPNINLIQAQMQAQSLIA